MTVHLLYEHHLEFLRLKGNCTGSSESTHIKIPAHCWKSHVAAIYVQVIKIRSFYLPTHCPPRSQRSVPLAVFNSTVSVLPPTLSEKTKFEPVHEISNNVAF